MRTYQGSQPPRVSDLQIHDSQELESVLHDSATSNLSTGLLLQIKMFMCPFKLLTHDHRKL